jgi:hypothetical protein
MIRALTAKNFFSDLSLGACRQNANELSRPKVPTVGADTVTSFRLTSVATFYHNATMDTAAIETQKPPRLNKRQKAFADALLAGLALVAAYRQAGYAEQKNPQMTAAAAHKVRANKKVQQYIAIIQDIAGETLEDARDREHGIDADGISESILTRVGMLKRLEDIANKTYMANLYETSMKAGIEICKIMGFHKPDQLQVAQVHFAIDYESAQNDDAADGLPVLDAPSIPKALPIGPASMRERLPDATQPVIALSQPIIDNDDDPHDLDDL